MKTSLGELIHSDLYALANPRKNIILNEETIRFMVHSYAQKGKLKTPVIVKANNLFNHLTQLLEEKTPINHPEQIQIIIEASSRSLTKQNSPENIHYFAMDLFLIPDKKPLALIANHSGGWDKDSKIFQYFSDLNIHFFIAGNQIFQSDFTHCPIFTLYHLLQTAADQTLLEKLSSLNRETPLYTQISWLELNPQYLIPAQSMKTITAYINYAPSVLLSEFRFDLKLTPGLFIDKNMKCLNKSIKLIAADLAGDAECALNDIWENQNTLIDVCYQKTYPEVYRLLKYIDAEFSKGSCDHPFFPFAFSHALVLESCLNSKTCFKDIVSNPDLLYFMHIDKIDPFEVFKYLYSTQTTTIPMLDANNSNQLKRKLTLLHQFRNHPEYVEELSKAEFFSLLTFSTSQAFFSNPLLCELFLKKYISIQDINKIIAPKIDQTLFKTFSTEEKILYLNSKFGLFMPLPKEKNEFESFEFLEVPDMIQEQNLIIHRPIPNAGLLANCMAQSIFAHKTHEDMNPSDETTLKPSIKSQN